MMFSKCVRSDVAEEDWNPRPFRFSHMSCGSFLAFLRATLRIRGTAEGGDTDTAGGTRWTRVRVPFRISRQIHSASNMWFDASSTPPCVWQVTLLETWSAWLSEPAARVTPPGPLVTSCSSIVDKGNFNSGGDTLIYSQPSAYVTLSVQTLVQPADYITAHPLPAPRANNAATWRILRHWRWKRLQGRAHQILLVNALWQREKGSESVWTSHISFPSPPRLPARAPTPNSTTIRANKWVRLQKEMTFLGGGHLSDRIRLKCVFCPRAFRQRVFEINKKKGVAIICMVKLPHFTAIVYFCSYIHINKIGSSVIIISQPAQNEFALIVSWKL